MKEIIDKIAKEIDFAQSDAVHKFSNSEAKTYQNGYDCGVMYGKIDGLRLALSIIEDYKNGT